MGIGSLLRCPNCGAYVMVTYIDTAGTHWWCPVCKETDRGYTYTYGTSTDYNELPRDKIREGDAE